MVSLTDYETSVYNLIQAPSSPQPLVPVASVDSAINTARGQVSLDGECVRAYGKLSATAAAVLYPFSLISFPTGPAGIQGPINVRMVTYQVGDTGNLRVNAREWEWFNNYVLSKPVSILGPPKYWAQFGQGGNGNFFINPLDTDYTLSLDTVCFPVPLTTGQTEETIPYSWTDAVPYYAAWQVLMSLQRQADANAMLQRYKEWVGRARSGATPSVLPHQYEQVPDPTIAAKIGIETARPQQQNAQQ